MENQQPTSKVWNISLWIAQGLLGIMFFMSGAMKLSQPIEKLSAMMPWAGEVTPALVRVVGLFELFGGIGLSLPSMLRIKPQFTVWAATGLSVVMLFAIIFHITHGEANVIAVPLVLGAISGFIAWGRSKKHPIGERNNESNHIKFRTVEKSNLDQFVN